MRVRKTRFIDGRLCSIRTAKRICVYEPSPYTTDYAWFRETLYRTRTGRFFLVGKGNAASIYRRTTDRNELAPGERWKVLSTEEARAWAEEHCSRAQYEAVFGGGGKNQN